jgi:hypothetical protein
MSSPSKRGKKAAHPAKQDGIDEGTFTSFPSPPRRFAAGPFLSRITVEDNERDLKFRNLRCDIRMHKSLVQLERNSSRRVVN